VAASVLVVFTLAMVGYSVVMRYFVGTPITGTDEMSGYLVVAIVMLGAADTLRRGEHINVDLLTARARGLSRRLLDIWAMAAAGAVAVTLIISGWLMLRFSIDFEIYSEGYLETPMWIPQSLILIGAGLLLAMAAARIVTLLSSRRNKDSGPGIKDT
jgi:TRAP-type C4-dicarboxylate transport system permease small subunit